MVGHDEENGCRILLFTDNANSVDDIAIAGLIAVNCIDYSKLPGTRPPTTL